MAYPPQRSPNYWAIDVTIPTDADGQSDAVPLYGRTPVGIYMPGTWTTGNLTFRACDTEAGTFVNMYSTAGSELTVTAAASLYLPLDPVNFHGVRFLIVRSGTSGTPVQQAGARSLVLMVADLTGR